MVLKILKKRKVPDELPDLATDEIEKKLDKKIKDINTEKEPEVKDELKQLPKKEEIKGLEKKDILEKEKPKIELIKKEPEEMKTEESVINKKGFFTELEKSLNKDIRNVSDLESWYNNRILSRDTVSDMKLYWEKQKNSAMMEILGKNLQGKIAEKTAVLQVLEKEWQAIYFELLEKEEKIRNEEKELKKLLSEFVEKCRNNKEEIDIDDKMNKFFEIESNDRKNKIIKIM